MASQVGQKKEEEKKKIKRNSYSVNSNPLHIGAILYCLLSIYSVRAEEYKNLNNVSENSHSFHKYHTQSQLNAKSNWYKTYSFNNFNGEMETKLN